MSTSAMTIAACLAALSLNPPREVTEEKVDLIEINHFHDDQGRPVFDQIIFYDWSPSDARYQIRDWRLLKSQNQVPLRNWRDGDFVAVWNDFKVRDVLRKTQAKMVRETWTQYDPELVEREFLPENKRQKLRDPAKLKNVASRPPAAEARTASPPKSADSSGTLRPLQNPVR